MSKSSRKSLPTLVIALCLLIAQAAMLTQSSAITHAAVTGPAIQLSQTYSAFGQPFQIYVTATGFAPSSGVVATFNAPYSQDGSVMGPRSLPPCVWQIGDNQSPLPATSISGVPADVCPNPVQPPLISGISYPNVVQSTGTTDGNGNLIFTSAASLVAGVGNPVVLIIPGGVVDGTYAVTLVDDKGNKAQAGYTVQRGVNAGQRLTVTPTYNANGSVSIEGQMRVVAINQTFNPGDVVSFSVQDFAASIENYTAQPGNGFAPLAGGLEDLPLVVDSCGTTQTTWTPGTSTTFPNPDFCVADNNGTIQALVQFQSITETDTPITSLEFYDQNYAIVAEVEGNINSGVTSTDLGTAFEGGVHLDHGQPQIALSTNQQTISGAFTVNGTGFGAYVPVRLYYVPFSATGNGGTGIGGSWLTLSPFFQTPFLLGTVYTDGSGHFLATQTLNSIPNLLGPSSLYNNSTTSTTFPNNLSSYPGYILAEDFSNIYPQTYAYTGRLNEAATAAFTVVNTGAQSGPLTIQAQAAATSTSPFVVGASVTAAVSSTVTVTGTGFSPGESVSVSLSNGASPCDAYPVTAVTANAQGVAVVTFVIPENCNTVTTAASGFKNGGTTVTVTLLGQQFGTKDTGTIIIPPTAVQIVPVNPAFAGAQTGSTILSNPSIVNALPVNLLGSGFAANDYVTFQFYAVDPFLGTIGTAPVLSVSGSADAAGNISVLALLPSINGTANGLTGGQYQLIGRGTVSGFQATSSVAYPFFYIQGNLNCPTQVLPGQAMPISGANFAAGTQVLVTVNANLTAVPTLTNALPTPLFTGLATVSPSGTFTITPTVAVGTASGNYTVTVSGLVYNATGGSYQQQLRQCVVTIGTVAPTIVSAIPNSGPIGTVVTVIGRGFGVNEPIQLSLNYINPGGALNNVVVGGSAQTVTTTDSTGAFTATYTVGSSVNALIAGQYNLTAVGLQTGATAQTVFTVIGTTPQVANPTTLFFAEGYTGSVAGGANADFTESLSILNANNYTTTYTVTYYLEDQLNGDESLLKTFTGVLGPNSVVERSVNTDAGPGMKVAASVTSPAPISASRIISRSLAGKALDTDSSLGQLISLSATAPTGGFNYYFASGDVSLTNEQYLTILNPNSTAATVTINFLPQAPADSTTVPVIAPITVTVPAMSRYTLPVRAAVIKAATGVTKFGMSVNSNVAVAVENVEYLGDGIGSGKYGAATKPAATTQYRQVIFSNDSGVFPTAGGNTWIGTGNDVSQIAIVNPGSAAAGSATVTVSAFDKNGNSINSQSIQVDGGTRETINVNDIAGTQGDVFSLNVTSDKNVVAEITRTFGGDPSNGGTFAASRSLGSPAGLTSASFPYLDLTSATGTPITQTVFLYNPGASPISVLGTFVAMTGTTVVKTYTVGANSITTVNVNADAASLPAGGLGGIFQVVNTGGTNGNTGASFVASNQSNKPDFSSVSGDQANYAIGGAQGS